MASGNGTPEGVEGAGHRGGVEPAGGEAQSAQRDECVAPPVAEPRIAGNHGETGAALDEVVFRGALERRAAAGAATYFIGGLLGVGASLGLIEILKMISPTENVPVLTTGSIVFSVAFALASGLLSGLYPASKAAHLDPITALRYE